MDDGGGEMVNLALGAGEVVSLTPSGREVCVLKSEKPGKCIEFLYQTGDWNHTISEWRGSDGQ